MQLFKDCFGNTFRLTLERKQHILKRLELKNQFTKIKETLLNPIEIRESNYDSNVHLYYRFYSKTPVGEKYLVVVAKTKIQNPFIITSFFTDQFKSGKQIGYIKPKL